MDCPPPPVHNVVLPYLGYINGGFPPGRMVWVYGVVLPNASRFAINLQCGPNSVPRDDIALHINPRFHDGHIVRNTLQNQSWGPEETYGPMILMRGQPFEMLILCEPSQFKIAINGQHFTDYPHRIPYQRVAYLSIDGDVTITQICYEHGSGHIGGPVPPCSSQFAPPPPYSTMPPYPPAPGAAPYPPGPSGPYPPQPGPYPAYPGHGAPYGTGYPPGCPPQPPGYPPAPPGYVHGSPHKGGLLDKASAALGGVLGTRHGAMAGTAVGAGLTGAALTGHLSPKKAAKKNKKMAKKALKYGLPVAGVGLGAYALSRSFHHHHSSSSSSSSSSEEE